MAARVLLALTAGVLLASTFLNWFPAGIEGAYLNRSVGAPAYSGVVSVVGDSDAWEAFSVLDVLMAALAAAAALAALVWRLTALASVAAAAAVLGGVVLYRAFDPPAERIVSLGPGMVVGFGSLVLLAAVAVAGVRRMGSRG